MILIPGAVYLFRLAAAIGDLPAVDWVLQNHSHQMSVKKWVLPILPLNLVDTVIF